MSAQVIGTAGLCGQRSRVHVIGTRGRSRRQQRSRAVIRYDRSAEGARRAFPRSVQTFASWLLSGLESL
jgi:hypothetical protein